MNAPRPSRSGEENALRELWTAVFGDDGEFQDMFFRELYFPGMAQVIEEDGKIVSAAYTIPFGKALYIYAVGTLPGYRGRGYGRLVTLAAAGGRGAYLCPAEESLKIWYREAMGAVPADRREIGPLPDDVIPVSSEVFVRMREELLKDAPHVPYPPQVLRLFALDGGFYRDASGAVYAADGNGTVREKVPSASVGEAYLFALNGAPSLHWGICLE